MAFLENIGTLVWVFFLIFSLERTLCIIYNRLGMFFEGFKYLRKIYKKIWKRGKYY